MKEWSLLLNACRVAIQKESKSSILLPASVFEGIDWKKFVELAQYHRVIPLAYKGIQKSEHASLVPIQALNFFKNHSRKVAIKNLKLTKELFELLALFKENGIEVIPYKGIIMAKMVYEEIGLRELTDFDLLVKLEDYEKIKALLLQRKYELQYIRPSILEQNNLKYNCECTFIQVREGQLIYAIDLHWVLGDKLLQLDIGYDTMQQFTNQRKLFKHSLQLLTPEGLLLSSLVHHGGKEQFSRLRHVCDIAAILEKYQFDIDWGQLLKKSTELKIKNLSVFGLALTARLFHFDLPATIQKMASSKKINNSIDSSIRLLVSEEIMKPSSMKSIVTKMKFHFYLRESLLTRLKIFYYLIIQMILPNTNDVQETELSRLAYWKLFLIKPFRLLKKNFF